MLTDAQCLRLLEDLRRRAQSVDVRFLLDWILERLAEREVAFALAAKSKADRRLWMKNYMRDYRAGKRRRGAATLGVTARQG